MKIAIAWMNKSKSNKQHKKVTVGVPELLDYGLVILKNLLGDNEKMKREDEEQQ